MQNQATGTFDLVAANLFRDLLIELFPHFPSRLDGGGELIVSGFLATQARSISRAAEMADLPLRDLVQRGKWMAARSTPQNRSSQNDAGTV
jgi:ribosomal protein L11 methyltransferase